MPQLSSCPTCDGFVPAHITTCLHCDSDLSANGYTSSRWPRWSAIARSLITIAGSGAVAITLMACYGAGPHYMNDRPNQCYQGYDSDGDGFCPPEDCDEANPQINPQAADPDQDGIDQNCDGADGINQGTPMVTPTDPATEPATPMATDPATDDDPANEPAPMVEPAP